MITKPPHLRKTTGSPHWDLCAAAVALAIKDIEKADNPRHAASARFFLASDPAATMIVEMIGYQLPSKEIAENEKSNDRRTTRPGLDLFD